MKLTLLNGRYPVKDARELLTSLVNVKIAFHESRLEIVQHTEEDIKHSQKRIRQLEAELHETLARISDAEDSVFLHAVTSVEMMVCE